MNGLTPKARTACGGSAAAIVTLASLFACGTSPAVRDDAGGTGITESVSATDVVETDTDNTSTTFGGSTVSAATTVGGGDPSTSISPSSSSGSVGPPVSTTSSTAEPTTTPVPATDPVTAYLILTSLFAKPCNLPHPPDARLWGVVDDGSTAFERWFCVDSSGYDGVRLFILRDGVVVLDTTPVQNRVDWYPGPAPGRYTARLTGSPQVSESAPPEPVGTTDQPALAPGFEEALSGRAPIDADAETAPGEAPEEIVSEVSFTLTTPDGYELVEVPGQQGRTVTLDIHGPDGRVRLGTALFPAGSELGAQGSFSETVLEASGGGLSHVVTLDPSAGPIACFAILTGAPEQRCDIRVDVG